MITAANTIEGAAKIALAKPALADAVVRAILKVQGAKYQTDECRNIVAGHAIEALDGLFAGTTRRKEVLEFVRREADNPRNATRKKAAEFLRKHQ